MGKLDFQRTNFSKEKKNKKLTFIQQTKLYLEDAYKDFESQYLRERKEDDSRDHLQHKWVKFNKNYRDTWKKKQEEKIKQDQPHQQPCSAIQNAAIILYKCLPISEKKFMALENYSIAELRYQITYYLIQGLQSIGVNPEYNLVQLESDRVCSKDIRALLERCDIKIIDCLSFAMNDVGDFVGNLNDTQVQTFYKQLLQYGQDLYQKEKEQQHQLLY